MVGQIELDSIQFLYDGIIINFTAQSIMMLEFVQELVLYLIIIPLAVADPGSFGGFTEHARTRPHARTRTHRFEKWEEI